MNFTPFIKSAGIESLNELQSQVTALPSSKNELLIVSPTGTGKTLAFLLRVLQSLEKDREGVQALILAPTRELALQIESVWRKLQTGYKVNCVYGGHDVKTEIQSLTVAPAVLIGTPGRVEDLLNRKALSLKTVHTLVLDEYDKSLQMGFDESMGVIVKSLVSKQRTILTSATTTDRVPTYLKLKHLYTVENSVKAIEKLELNIVKADAFTKSNKLIAFLSDEKHLPAILFVNTKDKVGEVCETLYQAGVFYTVFHGDLDQMAREKNLVKFRNGTVNVLVATDLAARGIDVPKIRSVIHFELPDKLDAFTHRNGRTARMNASGKAIVFEQPSFLDDELPEFVPEQKEYIKPQFETLYIDKGRKQKISKGDVAGFLSKNTDLGRDEIGLIELKDNCVFVAVARKKSLSVISSLKKVKIKGKSCRVEVAR